MKHRLKDSLIGGTLLLMWPTLCVLSYKLSDGPTDSLLGVGTFLVLSAVSFGIGFAFIWTSYD